ncbi:MAG: acetyl-CoA carboxylase carboxyltransferase subunit alpha [Chlamydiae bacterium]|jgi:acetyl-CoA carboxylase carboxyl transferase subunit alpha|nr:acetyl-CoA carboxylase carboxyltransferase subunit alpha [Chlamydiota bacterium]
MLQHEKKIHEYEQTILKLKEQMNEEAAVEVEMLQKRLAELKERVYSELSPWEKVTICRHPKRPHSIDYIEAITDEFFELSGDRYFKDDKAIIGGLGIIGGKKFMIIGQEKGFDTESRIYRNFGMTSPDGYRKALRLLELAEKFEVPVLCLIDTPGAYPGLDAEERGQGRAIADNLFKMSRIKTPIIAVIIGEGCSGGALGIGIADTIGILEHAYYSVISPEGCASILWKDSTKNADAAKALRMHAQDLIDFKMVDIVIKEPQGGAHHDPALTCQNLKEFVLTEVSKLENIPVDELIELRYQKFRKIGKEL